MSLRGERASAGLFVTVLLLLAGAFASGVVLAEESGPGCGVEVLPCEIEPGTHEGTLQPGINGQDHYSFTPPDDPAAIRVEVHSDADVEAVLRDPEGRVRGVDDGLFGENPQVSAVAMPAGEWTLEIRYAGFISYPIIPPDHDPYTFTLSWAYYDHVEQIDLEQGEAPMVTFELDRSAHVEILHRPDSDPDPTVFRSIASLLGPDDGYTHTYTFMASGIIAEELKTWGEPAGDHHVEADLPISLADSYPMDVHHDEATPATVVMAYSTSEGIKESTAWVAHNGSSPTYTQREGHAFYHRVTEMEGGQGHTAGGTIDAQDLWAEEEVPSSPSHRTSIYVEAHNPGSYEEPTTATVTKPNGDTVSVVDDWLYFYPHESGTWRVDFEHIDGEEGNQVRFYGWSFPIYVDVPK